MPRSRHPDKEIEEAVAYAEQQGWTVKPVKGHARGSLYCAHHDRDGCKVSVWSTPRSPGNHARALVRAIDRCPHQERREAGDEES
jgi:hypothetical protein